MRRRTRGTATGLLAIVGGVGLLRSIARPDDEPTTTLQAPASPRVPVMPSAPDHPPPAVVARASEADDLLARHALLRDDVNPKPRLRLIDAWAREHEAGDDIALLGQTMVDPDESVQERARPCLIRRWRIADQPSSDREAIGPTPASTST